MSMIFGTWTKLAYFGKHFQIIASEKGKECKGGKNKSTDIYSCLFCHSIRPKREASRHLKSEKPRCLKRFDKSQLPVDYYSQKKAWMEIMTSFLTKLNRRLGRTNCNILLLLDNAGCHPQELKTVLLDPAFFQSIQHQSFGPLILAS